MIDSFFEPPFAARQIRRNLTHIIADGVGFGDHSVEVVPEYDAIKHVLNVTRPALLLASQFFTDDIRRRLLIAGVQDAVAWRDSAPIVDWVLSLLGRQGISNTAADAFDAAHGGITFDDIGAGLGSKPSCRRLRSYWHFGGCGYRKGVGTCAEPDQIDRCPLPRHDLRKGLLNEAAYHLKLFLRDICGGDFVGWIDDRLAAADLGIGADGRAALMRAALIEPLTHIVGTGSKVWSMILAELLLAGDPDRERWVTTGASFVAVDGLVHAYLHRTGVLARFDAAHGYGPACYAPGGCADIIAMLARQIDAREFNPGNPTCFPRFVQFAIWSFCSGGGSGWDICNGNRIDDRAACRHVFCPTFQKCDRLPLR